MGDARQFAIDLEHAGLVMLAAVDKLGRRLALEGFVRIVYRTPRDTGRAQLSWNLSREQPDGTVPPPGSYTTAQALSKQVQLVPQPESPTDIWIASNLGYILDLENGRSRQAPAGGIVALTVAELQTIVLPEAA